jgi:hypothetical protein
VHNAGEGVLGYLEPQAEAALAVLTEAAVPTSAPVGATHGMGLLHALIVTKHNSAFAAGVNLEAVAEDLGGAVLVGVKMASRARRVGAGFALVGILYTRSRLAIFCESLVTSSLLTVLPHLLDRAYLEAKTSHTAVLANFVDAMLAARCFAPSAPPEEAESHMQVAAHLSEMVVVHRASARITPWMRRLMQVVRPRGALPAGEFLGVGDTSATACESAAAQLVGALGGIAAIMGMHQLLELTMFIGHEERLGLLRLSGYQRMPVEPYALQYRPVEDNTDLVQLVARTAATHVVLSTARAKVPENSKDVVCARLY